VVADASLCAKVRLAHRVACVAYTYFGASVASRLNASAKDVKLFDIGYTVSGVAAQVPARSPDTESVDFSLAKHSVKR